MNNSQSFIIDTNVLLRFILKDDVEQYEEVKPYFVCKDSVLIIPTVTLCETVWVLKKQAKIPNEQIVKTLVALSKQSNVIVDNKVFGFGISFLQHNGDFADGVIACETLQFADAELLTFDKNAKKIAQRLSLKVKDL